MPTGNPDDKTGEGGGGGDRPFTDEQREDMIRTQNAAMSAHHTRMQKVMDQKIDGLKESISTTIADAMAEMKKAEADAGKGQGKGSQNGADDIDERVKAIQADAEARVAALESKVKATEQKAAEEATRTKTAEERAKLNQALRAANVPDGLVKAAASMLYTENKTIGRDSESRVVFRMQREHQGQSYVEDLTLDKGIEEWLASPEGKHFAPARGAMGSGAQGGQAGNQVGGQKKSMSEKKRNLVRAILADEQ